jgi:hypothetical protein
LEHIHGIPKEQHWILGKQIDDQSLLSDYNICKDWTLFFVLHLCGGKVGKGTPSSSKLISFQDAVINKSSTPTTWNHPMPSEYNVEKLKEVLLL